MEDLAEKWTTNSTSALNLSLADENNHEEPFKPLYTYPIYGDKEMIWGYEQLQLMLKFDATSLLPFVSETHKNKLNDPSVGDPVAELLEQLPKSTCIDEKSWMEKRSKEIHQFILPGEQYGVEFVDADDNTYKIQHVKLNTKSLKELHYRMRIFILLFIEAGSYIDEDDDRWEFFLLYQTNGTFPKFVGFCSAYPYFYYKDSESHNQWDDGDDQWPIRMRISQFVILPVYQQRQLGQYLYNTLFKQFLKNDRIKEVTVEDPSEKFDDLRDRCDLERLAKSGVWSSSKLENVKELDSQWLEQTRLEQKMAPRQFMRCVEMALLHKFGEHKNPDKNYKLLVKQRLFVRNHDALADMTKSERIEKLDEVYTTLVEDYHRIIEPVDFSQDKKGKKRVHTEIS